MPRPIKILYLIEGNGGGAITHALTLARKLPPDRFSCSVAFFMDGPSVSLARESGLRTTLMPRRRDMDITLAWRIFQMLKTEGIDILHTHTITGNFYARWAASLTVHRPILLTTVHSFVIDELQGQTRVTLRDWFRYKRDIYGQCFTRHFLAVSEKLRKRMIENGIPPEKITVIENGVEVTDPVVCAAHRVSARAELGLNADEIAVGIAGRLVPLKNHDLFLQVAHRLSRQHEKLKFIIIGDGVLRKHLEETSWRLGLAGRVIFTGWRNDARRLIAALDIYALCSLTEGLNISILEAMACGIPVVGSDIKGIADIVQDGQTGLLFPSGDLEAFVAALGKLIQNRAWAEELGRKGRGVVEKRFSVESMVERTAGVYLKSL